MLVLSFFFFILSKFYVTSLTISQVQISPELTTISSLCNYELKMTLSVNMHHLKNSEIQTFEGNLKYCYFSNLQGVGNITNCVCANKICTIPLIKELYFMSSILFGPLKNPSFLKSQMIPFSINSTYSKFITINENVFSPGRLFNQIIRQDSYKIAALTNYYITFQFENNVTKGGRIIIIFPADNSLVNLNKIILSDGVNVDYEATYTIIDSLKINITINFDLSTSFSSKITIKLFGVKNSLTLNQAPSIKIETRTSEFFLIGRLDSSLSPQATVPGSILLLSLTAAPPQISKPSNVFLSIQPEATFARNGRLEIIFPPEFTYNASIFSCPFTLGLNNNIENEGGTCFLSDRIVTTKNFFYPEITQPISLVITGVINPNSTKNSSSFKIRTVDELDRTICELSDENSVFQAQPGSLLIKEAKRDKTRAGESFTLGLKIIIENNFPRQGYFYLMVPLIQGIYVENLSCYDGQGGKVGCNAKNGTTGIEIWVQEMCSKGEIVCKAGSEVEIVILGFVNPYFVSQNINESIVVRTLGEDMETIYDMVQTNVFLVPFPQPNPIDYVQISRIGSNLVGDIVNYRVEFTSTEFLRTKNGDFLLVFPFEYVLMSLKDLEYFLIDSTSSELSKKGDFGLYANSESIQWIKIYSICDRNCADINLKVIIKNLRNPTTTRPLANLNSTIFFKVTSFTLDQRIISSQKESILTSDLSVLFRTFKTDPILAILDPTTNVFSDYRFSLKTDVEIPIKGKIVLHFPIFFNFTNFNEGCQTFFNGSLSNDFSSSFSRNELVISSKMNEKSFFYENIILVNCAKLLNPRSLSPFSIKFYSKTEDDFTIQNSEINMVLSSINDLKEVSMKRNNVGLGENVVVDIDIQFSTPVQINDKVEINLARDQIDFNSNSLALVIANTQKSLDFSMVYNNSYIIISTVNYDCAYCLTLSYNIKSGLKNVNTMKPATLSNKISLYDNLDFLIQSSKSLILMQPPLSSGNLSNIIFAADNYITWSNNNLTINFSLQTEIPDKGKIYIKFPENLFFPSDIDKNTCFCKNLNNLNDLCKCSTSIANLNSLGVFIDSLIINPLCDLDQCNSNKKMSFIIFNTFKNAPSNETISNKIFINTLDANNLTIDSGTFNADSLKPIYFNNFNSLKFTRTENQVGQITSLSIEISIKNRVKHLSKFYFILSKDQIQSTDSNECYFTSSNGTLGKLFCEITSNSSHIILCFDEYYEENTFVPENSNFQILIKNLRNVYSIISNPDLMIRASVYSQNRAVLYMDELKILTIENDLLMSDLADLNYKLSSSKIASDTNVQLNFKLKSSVPPYFYLYLTFPSRFIYLESNVCNIIINDIKENCNILKKENQYGHLNIQEISVKSSIKIFSEANTPFTIVFNGINNFYPLDFSKEKILIFINDNKNQNISKSFYEFLSLIQTSILLNDQSYSFNRNTTNLEAFTEISITFILPSKLIFGVIIRFTLSKRELNINNAKIKIFLVSPLEKTIPFNMTQNETYYTIDIQQDFCSQFCPQNTNLTVLVTNVQNPSQNILSLPSSFISSFLPPSNFLYQPNNGRNFHPLLLSPSFKNLSIIRNNSLLLSPIFLRISIILYSPASNSQSLSIRFPSSLIYVMHSSFSLLLNGNSNFVSSKDPLISFSILNDQYSFSYLATLEIKNICSFMDCSSTEFSFSLFEITNPCFLIPLKSSFFISLSFSDAENRIICQDFFNTDLVEPKLRTFDIKSIWALRGETTPLKKTLYSFKFGLEGNVLEGSIGKIILPKDVVRGNEGIICKGAGKEIGCSWKEDGSSWLLEFEEFCSKEGCEQGMELNVTNMVNPAKNIIYNTGNSIKIMIESKFGDVYHMSSDTIFIKPEIYQYLISSLLISRNESEAGSPTQYTVSFFLPSSLESSDLISINPPSFLLLPPITSIHSIVFSINHNYIEEIMFQRVCPNSCPLSSLIVLSFVCYLPSSTFDFQTSSSFYISLSSLTDFARGSFQAKLLPIVTPGRLRKMQISSKIGKVGVTDDISLNFILKNKIPKKLEGGFIKIILPSEIRTNNISVILGGKNGNVKSIKEELVIIEEQGGDEIGEIIVQLNTIVNPGSVKPTGGFRIESYREVNGKTTLIDQNVGLCYEARLPGDLMEVTMKRSSDLLQEEISLNISIKIANSITKGKVKINFINNFEIQKSNKNELDCIDLQNNKKISCTFIESLLIINEIDGSSGQKLNWMITGLMNSPKINKNRSSISIETSTFDSYLIDGSYKISILPPLIPFSLIIKSLNRSNNSFFSASTLTLSLSSSISPSLSSSLSLLITFPDLFLLNSISSSYFNVSYDSGYLNKILYSPWVCPCDEFQVLINGFNGEASFGSGKQEIAAILKSIEGFEENYVVAEGTGQISHFLEEMVPLQIWNWRINVENPVMRERSDWIITFYLPHRKPTSLFGFNLSFPNDFLLENIIESDYKCKGLLRLPSILNCYTKGNSILLLASSSPGQSSAYYSFKILDLKNPDIPSSRLILSTFLPFSGSKLSLSYPFSMVFYHSLNYTQCPSYCRTCMKDSFSNYSCLSCYVPSAFPLLFNSSCVSVCPSGYSAIPSGECVEGEEGGGGSLCGAGLEFNGTCVTVCPIGYFDQEDEKKCMKCGDKCEECEKEEENCIKCKNKTNVLENGSCVEKCSSNYTLVNGSICRENCDNKKCLHCSSINTSKCIECSSPFAYLSNDDCKLQTDICPNSTYIFNLSSTNLSSPNQTTSNILCKPCTSLCLSCSYSPEKCTSCYLNSSFPYLYSQTCVPKCPEFISSPSSFICSLTPLAPVATPPLSMAPQDWLFFLIISIFLLEMLFLLLSIVLSSKTLVLANAIVSLMQICDFLTKLGIFVNFFALKNLAATTISFLVLTSENVLSLLFNILHLGVLEQVSRKFSELRKENLKFYKIVEISTYIFGINFILVHGAGLYRFSKNNFESLDDYRESLKRFLKMGSVFKAVQIILDIYILVDYDGSYRIFHLGYLSLFVCSIQVPLILVKIWKLKGKELIKKN